MRANGAEATGGLTFLGLQSWIEVGLNTVVENARNTLRALWPRTCTQCFNFTRSVACFFRQPATGMVGLVMTIVTPSLLITDDDRDLRETLGSVFAERGFKTHLAANGEEAVEIVQSQAVHVLLLDMHMPRLTGLETIRRIKQLSRPVPTILMSAALDPRITQEAHEENVFSVLPKPFSFRTIRDIVREVLRRSYSWQGE